MVAGSSPFCRRMSAWAVKRAGGLNSFLGGFYVLKGFIKVSLLKMVESKECMNGWVLWMLVLKVLEE